MAKKPTVYLGTESFERNRIKNAGIYIRISTFRGNQSGSIDSQLSKLVDYVRNQLLLRLRGIYVDVGSGRSAESRKDLRRLMDDCRRREIEAIVTKSVSRFGRNTVDTLTLCRQLKEIGVDVYFVTEQIYYL